MKISKYFASFILGAVFLVSSVANATLIGILDDGVGNWQAYYDDVADLTWLADANAAVGSIYDTFSPGSGQMNWVDANTWAAGLTVGGVTGWRLPDTVQTDESCDDQFDPGGGFDPQGFGFNCIGSEMGDLFYNALGNTAGSLSNTGPFSNVQFTRRYWSATGYEPNTLISAWSFNMSNGHQDFNGKGAPGDAWAVQSGDVSAVPEPGTLLLMSVGMLGLMGIAKRKKA